MALRPPNWTLPIEYSFCQALDSRLQPHTRVGQTVTLLEQARENISHLVGCEPFNTWDAM
jgi:hypothetical protein